MIYNSRNHMLNMLRNRIIWFDLETGGLNPLIHPIIEIAALDNHGNTFQSLIKTDEHLDPKIVELTNITDELLQQNGKSHENVMKDFYQYLAGNNLPPCLKTNHRTFVIAHNGDRFDKVFLQHAFNKWNIIIPPSVCFIDTLRLSRMVMPELTSHRLQSIAQRFNIDTPNAHRAMGDVLVLTQIWAKLVERFGESNNGKNDVISIYNRLYNI